jgi:cell division protein FtsW
MIRVQSPRRIAARERVLLLMAALFVSIIHITLLWTQDIAWTQLWMVGVWLACGLGLHIILSRQLPTRDPYLLPGIFLLTGWGIVTVYRLQPRLGERQVGWLVVSSVAMVALMSMPHDLGWLRRYRYTWLLLGVALLVITIFIGVNPSGEEFNPPRLWLQFGEVFYQPSELMKILLVAFMASYLSDHWISLRRELIYVGRFKLPALSFFAPILLMWGLSLVILVWQRDLGTATLFFVVFMLMFYLASGQALLLLGGIGLLGLASLVAYLAIDVVALRIDIWLNPWPEADGRAFQIVQSLMAVAAGGVLGQGIGQGLPTAVPVAHSDFIFAAIAEEWGLIGIIGLLSVLLLITLRGFRIALLNQHRPFASLLAAGLSLMLSIQSLLIIGGALRLWPLTGVTLPFVSYGGSSLLTGFTMIGLLLILSNQSRQR